MSDFKFVVATPSHSVCDENARALENISALRFLAPLAATLEKMMSDETLRQRFGRRAPQSVLEKNMTADKMVAAYERLYANF